MWLFEEDEDWEEWRTFRDQAHGLEEEHLRIRTALQEAEQALRSDPDNQALRARVEELEGQLRDLEQRAPWISWPHAVEVLLWGVPHG